MESKCYIVTVDTINVPFVEMKVNDELAKGATLLHMVDRNGVLWMFFQPPAVVKATAKKVSARVS